MTASSSTAHGGLAGDSTASLVGRRIAIDGDFATIRYHGSIPGKPGDDWIGVEWDDPQRGKHSGTIGSMRLFTTRVDGAGSFLSAKKPGINWGTGFVSALKEKYLADQPSDGIVVLGEAASSAKAADPSHHSAPNTSVGRIEVETVGWDKIKQKQSQLERLTEIGLAGQSIYRAVSPDTTETEEQIATLCASVVDLDLSKNLFASWTDVSRIVRHMPSLRLLRLSSNRMNLPDKSSKTPSDDDKDIDFNSAFGRLRQVTLMRMMMSWREIAAVEKWFTDLEELHVGFNGIAEILESTNDVHSSNTNGVDENDQNLANFETIDNRLIPVTGFANLHTINLEGNHLSKWIDVGRFAWLPQLTVLNLCDNAIESVLPAYQLQQIAARFISDESDRLPFAKLRSINLSGNKLSSWTDIHALNSYESLVDIRVKRNPVVTTADRGVFWELVARLERVTQLNGSVVSARDRLDSELAYLSKCSQAKIQLSPEEFIELHPRYDALCRVHGEPTAAPAALVSGALRDRLLKIKAVHVGHGSVQERRLPGTLKAKAARMLLQRAFGDSAAANNTLVWIRGSELQAEQIVKMSAAEVLQHGIVIDDNEWRDLSSAGIESGDIVSIVPK